MTVSVVMIRVLVEACELVGVSCEKLLVAAGVDGGCLDDSNARVPMRDYERVQLAALDLTGDAALGLHMGERASFAGFDVMASLIAHAATLRDGLNTYLKFNRILSDDPDSDLHESAGAATLRLGIPPGNPRSDRLRAELAMAGFLRLIRHFAGPDSVARRVCFQYPAPDYAHEYRRIFGGAERFEQAFTGIEIDRALLACAPLHKDPELYQVLETQAMRKVSRLTRATSVRTRVEEYLGSRALSGRPDMAEVAQQLGMSERSLRRRLANEGITYTQLFEQALASAAKRMLRDPAQSILGAAYAMGFSDSSAFHRAFKRWTGVTPKQYRDQQ
ncbi:MAG TPA: AraC family transcriptional regulator [Polyangiaceae bacterium]